jgi:hypothetical protein
MECAEDNPGEDCEDCERHYCLRCIENHDCEPVEVQDRWDYELDQYENRMLDKADRETEEDNRWDEIGKEEYKARKHGYEL